MLKRMQEPEAWEPQINQAAFEALDMAIEALSQESSEDVISRQAAIEVIEAVLPVDPMKSEYAKGITCGAALAKTYVEQLPSTQTERKKGKWIPVTNGRGGFECNRCHCYAPSYQDGVEWLSAFCPSCGCRMEGEQE